MISPIVMIFKDDSNKLVMININAMCYYGDAKDYDIGWRWIPHSIRIHWNRLFEKREKNLF